ncbi:tRNA (adenosine(37)-N6)-threonylcarbamoyltransferase complex ATPase subunit type 1 TsaE [Arvimicrobium flavum]|uniref:tRNA (adenosine(37)-N6)-threonylcarbamoyltransferase complex ATPase subunit type 1 TsaE n=1 Tax=Arvimicrobium flavum TaxID=3393320 RepID=UPI00237AA40D|nr:tRNA (adenosine(37)-N6)-threonylcarbamoyltransferase complex ATPase subunit type 1 TsaE [Mesorhizobium shangrilense]
MTGPMLERFLASEADTVRLGQDLAQAIRPGDVLALHGDLGAGKTTLARSLIRAVAADPELDVPSPTFTLVQSYEARVPIHHFDLYRLSSPDELGELGFDEAREQGAALVEWPDRAGDALPKETLHIDLTHEGNGRLVRIAGGGGAFERVQRSLAMRDFLGRAGWGEADRRRLAGDASARSYETVVLAGREPRILMNSPPLVLGPPVKDGKAYAEIAHTARTVAAFVAVDRALADAGVSVPTIYAQDLDRGFLLIENLGSDGVIDPEGRPIVARYRAAAELLAWLHEKPSSPRLPVAPGIWHDVPPFDREAMLIEVALLLDWYVPWATGKPASDSLRREFDLAWSNLSDRLASAETGLVQRDYHSPNLIWREGRSGHDRLGIIDFQDALIGPLAYDVASLAMDARVTVPADVESATVEAYVSARKAAVSFDADAFAEAYAITAAQRNSKILGIFVRLDRRDGKPAYLKHLPRIRDYLRRALAHPALADIADLYRRHGLLDEVSA